ncbi:unnamed protein product [Pieris brassicae]|uniref:Uncharacterized protein n=1 Tax=Pieris brassicae TaxID=7116 RepID=A0A9P0TCW7_PIEBR|nr:unnamed protein product [Pieris brassicae]
MNVLQQRRFLASRNEGHAARARWTTQRERGTRDEVAARAQHWERPHDRSLSARLSRKYSRLVRACASLPVSLSHGDVEKCI